MNESVRLMAFTGGIAAAIATCAWIGDYRRVKRRDLDRVGFMPWTTIFFWSLLAAVLLLGISARAWLGG